MVRPLDEDGRGAVRSPTPCVTARTSTALIAPNEPLFFHLAVCHTLHVGKSTLGRVVDPGALSACGGPRARLSIEVPEAWLAEGADVAVTAPARLVCARCDGGGCEGCARSGALRSPEGDRVVHASFPPAPRPPGPRALALRIPHPFGAGHAIEQLLLELRPGAAPSACVERVTTPARTPIGPGAPPSLRLPWALIAASVVAAVLFCLLGR